MSMECKQRTIQEMSWMYRIQEEIPCWETPKCSKHDQTTPCAGDFTLSMRVWIIMDLLMVPIDATQSSLPRLVIKFPNL